jgi:alkyl hydroperoxide reductase subunit AhpC
MVRFASANDLDIGRNVAEVLRVLDGLRAGELVACNWKKGDHTLTQQMR